MRDLRRQGFTVERVGNGLWRVTKDNESVTFSSRSPSDAQSLQKAIRDLEAIGYSQPDPRDTVEQDNKPDSQADRLPGLLLADIASSITGVTVQDLAAAHRVTPERVRTILEAAKEFIPRLRHAKGLWYQNPDVSLAAAVLTTPPRPTEQDTPEEDTSALPTQQAVLTWLQTHPGWHPIREVYREVDRPPGQIIAVLHRNKARGVVRKQGEYSHSQWAYAETIPPPPPSAPSASPTDSGDRQPTERTTGTNQDRQRTQWAILNETQIVIIDPDSHTGRTLATAVDAQAAQELLQYLTES